MLTISAVLFSSYMSTPAFICSVNEAIVRRALLAQCRRFPSWRVVHTSDPVADDLEGNHILCEVAARGSPDGFYYHISHGLHSIAPADDIDAQCTVVSGDTQIITRPFRRIVWKSRLSAQDHVPRAANHDLFFLAVGWWPLGRPSLTRDGGIPIVLADVAQHPKYRLAESMEVLQGRTCHRIEWPHHDRLWVCPELGYAVVAREHMRPGTGEVLQRLEMSDWREIRPGTWFPFVVRNQVSATGNDPTGLGRAGRSVDSTFRFITVEVDAPGNDPRFMFLEPPGTLHIATDGSFRQVTEGGQDYLDAVTNWVVRHALPSNRVRGENTPDSDGTENVVFVAVAGLSAGTFYWRRRRRTPGQVAA